MSKETCKEMVIPAGAFGSFHRHACGKPAKGKLKNGEPACGIHLYQEKRNEKAKEKYNEELEVREKFHKEMKAFSIKHNICLMSYNAKDRKVMINFDVLEEIIENKKE